MEKTKDKNWEILAILGFAFAGLLGFFLYAPLRVSGLIGEMIQSIFLGVGGSSSYLIPVLTALVAWSQLTGKLDWRKEKRWLFAILLWVNLISLISLLEITITSRRIDLSAAQTSPELVMDLIASLWNQSQPSSFQSGSILLNGGLVGKLIALSLSQVIGKTGTLILLLGSFFALIVQTFNYSFLPALKKIQSLVLNLKIQIGEAFKHLMIRREKKPESTPTQHREEVVPPPVSYDLPLTFPNGEWADEPQLGQGVDNSFNNSLPVEREQSSIKESTETSETDWPEWSDMNQYRDDFGLFPEGSSRKIEIQSQKPLSRSAHIEAHSRFGESHQSNEQHTPERAGQTETRRDASQDQKQIIRSVYLPIKDEYLLSATAEPTRGNTPVASTRIYANQSEKPTSISSSDSSATESLKQIAETIQEDQSSLAKQSESDRSEWMDRAGAAEPSKEGKTAHFRARKGERYVAPSPNLLQADMGIHFDPEDKEAIRLLGAKLEKTLNDFGVDAKVINFITGPTITRFELKPGPGVKVSKIVNLSDDIALALAATGLRIEAPIPGKSAIGIEIPNQKTKPVLLRSLIESAAFKKHPSPLCAALGRDIQGGEILCDLAAMPHLLIAGATGSGKSVCINSILISLLCRSGPEELRLMMIDPKVVELSVYNGIPHLMQPVVTDPKKAYGVLNYAVEEMNRRYGLFAAHSVRDFKNYNQLVKDGQIEGGETLPLILIVIDELSDLMATTPTEVETAIGRLTAMARAAGIHLIIATQRPSVDVITGVIKANIPSRIAFAVASQVDSRTILDMAGAEKLLGKGDMLYYPQSVAKPLRGQGAFVTDAEVERVIEDLKKRYGSQYDEAVARAIDLSAQEGSGTTGDKDNSTEEDELLLDALRTCVETGYASVSLLQRRLTIGYPRAARLIDALHDHGWIGPFEGSKPRKVLMTPLEYDQMMAESDS